MTLSELTLVRLIKQVEHFPAGNIGTIVHVYLDGLAYEVEFDLPAADRRQHSVTVDAKYLEKVT